MKVTLDKTGRVVGMPFFVDLTIHDFNGDGEQYMQYVDALRDQHIAEAGQAEPGQPLRSAYPPDSVGEARFNAALTSWSVQQGVSQAMQQNRPPAQPMPRELAAIVHGNESDKRNSADIMAWRARAQEQEATAAKYLAFDGRESPRVLDARQRAAQYEREVQKLSKTKFSHEVTQETEALKYGEAELDKAMKLSASELEKNLDHVHGLIQGFRQMSETDYSYAMDGKALVKVRHPNVAAKNLEAVLGSTDDNFLVQKLSMHGIERHEEEKAEAKEEAQPTIQEMTLRDYEKYVEGQEAKAAAKNFDNEVRPGMFGG